MDGDKTGIGDCCEHQCSPEFFIFHGWYVVLVLQGLDECHVLPYLHRAFYCQCNIPKLFLLERYDQVVALCAMHLVLIYDFMLSVITLIFLSSSSSSSSLLLLSMHDTCAQAFTLDKKICAVHMNCFGPKTTTVTSWCFLHDLYYQVITMLPTATNSHDYLPKKTHMMPTATT